MTAWRDNAGHAPREIAGVPIARVFVELRNGTRPEASWPVDTGRRGETTCWSLTGGQFDIVKWRPA